MDLVLAVLKKWQNAIMVKHDQVILRVVLQK